MDTQTQTTNALAQLIGHCQERNPHFESERGQLDMFNALAERQALVDALRRLLRAFESDYEGAPDLSIEVSWETNSQAVAQARAALASSEGK